VQEYNVHSCPRPEALTSAAHHYAKNSPQQRAPGTPLFWRRNAAADQSREEKQQRGGEEVAAKQNAPAGGALSARAAALPVCACPMPADRPRAHTRGATVAPVCRADDAACRPSAPFLNRVAHVILPFRQIFHYYSFSSPLFSFAIFAAATFRHFRYFDISPYFDISFSLILFSLSLFIFTVSFPRH
jgi:hypothetical protein